MIFAFILLIIISIICIVLFTNIRIKIKYNNDLAIDFYFGVFRIPENLFKKIEKKEKQNKSEKQNIDKTKINKEENILLKKIKKNGYYQSLLDIVEFLSPSLKELNSFFKKVKVNPLKIDIKMVGDDAAKLAIDYGKFCAIYYPLIELVDTKTNCKNINSNVYVDYVDKSTIIFIKTELKFRLVFGIMSGLKIIMLFNKLKDKFK